MRDSNEEWDRIDEEYFYELWKRKQEADWQRMEEHEKRVIRNFKNSIIDGFTKT